MTKEVKVYKVREGAKTPERYHPNDAGVDFFFAPPSNEAVTINPGESHILQTGIKLQVPEDCMLQIMNKSGIAFKKSLVVGACVVDSGYDGEIFINLHNIGQNRQVVSPGQKLAQGVFVRIERPFLVETGGPKIYESHTSRGDGALGSTGEF